MAASVYNRLAGAYLREKRSKLGMTQPAFAWALSDRVGLQVSAFSLTYYERGRHAIPAAVLLAAQSMRPPRRKHEAKN
jgi:hypothetical protein